MSSASKSGLSLSCCLAVVLIAHFFASQCCLVVGHPPLINPTIAPDVIEVNLWSREHGSAQADNDETIQQQQKETPRALRSRNGKIEMDKILALDKCEEMKSKNWKDSDNPRLKKGEFASFVEIHPSDRSRKCAGTLIGPRVVLTSSACFDNNDKIDKVTLGLTGEHIKKDIVSTCKLSEESDQDDLHDLAVVILNQNTRYRDTIQPACLSNWLDHDRNGDYVTVSESLMSASSSKSTSVVWMRMAFHRESLRNKTVDMHIDSADYPKRVCPITTKMDWTGQPLYRIEDNKPYLVGVARSLRPKKDICDIEDYRRRHSGQATNRRSFSHVHWIYTNLLDETGKHLIRAIKSCIQKAEAQD